VSRLNDPAVVRAQYADETGLRARQALWRDYHGDDPKAALWNAVVAAAPRRVLEVGGGDGWLAARVQEELGAEVTMLDQSPRMVELAAQRGVRALVGDVQALPFDDGSFDTVLACWMLYHVTEVDRGLAEIARVLEPGGLLIANTNSRRHCAELFELIEYPQSFRDNVFTAENGEATLARHFADVSRRDVVGYAVVADRETLVAYADSVSAPTQPVPEDVPLPFVVHSRGAVFVATR